MATKQEKEFVFDHAASIRGCVSEVQVIVDDLSKLIRDGADVDLTRLATDLHDIRKEIELIDRNAAALQ